MKPFHFEPVADGVWRLRLVIVNLYAVEAANGWVLVDTGPPGFANVVQTAAYELFGDREPNAILLTHAHFDHAGNAPQLAEAWDVPVVCHEQELPYITGKSDYPPQDPTLGGAMSFMERFFPYTGCNVGERARVLPQDGSVSELPGWRWIPTPGHTVGQVSFFRDEDRLLIAGDAFVTTDLDSWVHVLAWRKQLCGPVKSFTPDWPAAVASVYRLVELRPRLAAPGHGDPWQGPEFASAFDEYASWMTPPKRGRYADQPAEYNDNGAVASIPPPVSDPLPLKLAIGGALVAAAAILWSSRRRS